MDFSKTRQQAEKKHMWCILNSFRKTYFTLGILVPHLYIFQRSTETARDLLCNPLSPGARPVLSPVHLSSQPGGAKGAFPWPQGAATELFWGQLFSQIKSRGEM